MIKSALSTTGRGLKSVASALYSLIKEPDGSKKLSTGRVAFWGVLSFAMYTWIFLEKDIPSTMENFLILIVSYVIGGKVVTGAKDVVAMLKKSSESTDEKNDGPIV